MTSHSEDPGEPSGRHAADRDGVLAERRVAASVPEVAHSLVLLDRPAAVTDNGVARITQIGAYAPPSSPGGPFRVDRGRISVRIDMVAVTGASLIDVEDRAADEGDALPELRLHGPRGQTAHRCHALEGPDRLVLDGLARLDGLPAAAAARGADYPLPRAGGELPDQLERIDDLLTGAVGHGQFIPHRHIDPAVLFALFEHVCAVGLTLGVAVLSSAALHTLQDVLETVSRSGRLTVVATHDAILEISLSGVYHCILLRLHGAHGPTSVLELYDAQNRCVALISQFGLVGADAHGAWEHLAASLPECV